MAKAQKRSNRELKKPKKTAAERAKASAATSVIATVAATIPGMNARDGQKKR